MTCTGVSQSNMPSQYGNMCQPQQMPCAGGGNNGAPTNGAPTGNSGDIGGPGAGSGARPPSTGNNAENPEVTRAIENIKNSGFGQTDKGREVVAKLEEMNRNGTISIQELGGNVAGLAGDGTLRVDDDLFGKSGRNSTLEGVLVHEATHELQADKGLQVGHGSGPYDPDQLQQAYLANMV